MDKKVVYLVCCVLLLGFASSTLAELVAYYPFDGNAKDVSGFGSAADGTLVGSPTFEAGPSGFGQALRLNGTSQYVNCGNPGKKFDITGQLAIMCWAKVAAWTSGGSDTLVAKGPQGQAYRLYRFGTGNPLLFALGGTTPEYYAYVSTGKNINDGAWHHIAGVWDGATVYLYIDGVLDDSSPATGSLVTNTLDLWIGNNPGNTTRFWNGWIDDVRIYNTSVSAAEIAQVMQGAYARPYVSRSPNPSNLATDVPRDTALSWTAGKDAVSHDVYLGTNAAVVEAATKADSKGVLAVAGQAASIYDPPGHLELGQTYYWRVDEVNNARPANPAKGDVWSFTVEPALYPIEGVVATASLPTAEGSGGPEVTVDGSGLINGLHGTGGTTMWSGEGAADDPVWLQYDFDRVYKLYGVHIWNYNGSYEFALGFGLKDVTIEYATEPDNWVTLGDFELTQATSRATYAGQVIELDGLPARAIRINVHSNRSPQDELRYGLSEIQFLYKPVFAREPDPADGATEVDRATSLSWRPGREAASHQVYFSTDSSAVAEGTALIDTTATSTYSPAVLALGTTYFWRIDEVNNVETPAAWDSDVWSFTVQEYVVIDDFERYTDDDGNRVYQTWLDGYGSSTNGSQVGNDNAPYMQKTNPHGGAQAMPFYYGTEGAAYSEAELTFTPAADWTVNGAEVLSLYHRGVPIGFYETPSGSILMNGTGEDIYNAIDQFRFAYKQLNGDGSITVRVDHVDDTHEYAKAGVMIRMGLATAPLQAHMVATPRDRTEWQYRPAVSADTTQVATAVDATPLPYWVRLTRRGNTFIGERSADGQTWLPITIGDAASSTTTLTMTDPVYIGLVVTSHAAGTVCGAEFSNVSVTGNVSAGWQLADIGADQLPGNGLDRFYVALEDSAGKKATFANPSMAAVATASWQQWAIPLKDITAAGVNPARITKLQIGVGDKTQPSKNASGVLYIDDIAFGRPIPSE